MTTFFQINGTPFEDYYVRRDMFAQGGLWSWGFNYTGSLGNNVAYVHQSSPVQTVAGGTNWKQVDNGGAVGAIKTDGTLWMWGYNYWGQVGDNTVASRSSPVQTISGGTNWKQVACGSLHTAAIKTDGTLWLWGFNLDGQLGNITSGFSATKSSPVQTVAGGTSWKQVSCGPNDTGAIKTDGTLWMWGYNYHGQLGDNTTTSRSSPVQTVAGGTNWKQLSVGSRSTCSAIKTDGTLWVWGNNDYKQIGDGTNAYKSSPVQISTGGTNWKQVSTGYFATGAIKTDGTLWMWGANIGGSLGTGDQLERTTPVQTVAGGTNWKQLSVGRQMHTAALKTDGTLWMWGGNSSGQFGDGTRNPRSSPAIVGNETNWRQISAGRENIAAVKDEF